MEPATVLPWEELLEYRPVVGWHTRPHLDTHARADGAFQMTTDGEGWRGGRPLDDADVAVFGDSFAFGHGVDDDEVYTEHAGALRAKAMGSDGYSMVHAVLWMEGLAPRLAGKQVLWMVYAGNDLYDNLKPNYGRYRMPFVRLRGGAWEIHHDHVSERPWPIPQGRTTYQTELARMCTPGFASARAFDAAGYLVRRARDIVSGAGARLTVLSVPHRAQIDERRLPGLQARSPDPERFDPRLPDRALEDRCEQLGVPFVALRDHLQPSDYQERDIHWNPRGHRKVGALVAALCSDQELAAS